MSTLKVDAIRHNSATSDAITTASDGTCTARITGMTGGSGLSHRNLIINGGMKVCQHSNSKSEAITGVGYHTVDMFKTVANSSMSYAVTMSQENDNPDGNGKSVKLLTTTASTPTGSENYCLRYTGEEQDISGAGLGTSSCKQLTISFSVKTNKTGTHGFQIYIGNNQPNMTVAYTVSSANTWERKTITFPTYTSSYSHNSDNAKGFMLDWNLSSGPDDIMAPYNWATGSTAARGVTGQVNMLDTVGNYFQLTNVQLEIGDTATSFEHRSFSDELRRCQRYYYQVGGQRNDGGPDEPYGVILPFAMVATSIRAKGVLQHPVNMRAAPGVSSGGSGAAKIQMGDRTGSGDLAYQDLWTNSNNTKYTWVQFSPNSGTISYQNEPGIIYANNNTFHLKVSAEL